MNRNTLFPVTILPWIGGLFLLFLAIGCSDEVPIEPLPSNVPRAPGNVSAVPGTGQATIVWDIVSGATGYNLYMASATHVSAGNYLSMPAGAMFPLVTIPYTVNPLTDATQYYFTVTAINGIGEGPESPLVTAIPGSGITLPPAPANPRATAGTGQVTLNWGAVTGTGAVSYTIYFASDPTVNAANFAGLPNSGTVSPALPGEIVGGLTAGIAYYFVITATDANGNSPESWAASATPL